MKKIEITENLVLAARTHRMVGQRKRIATTTFDVHSKASFL
ncbi:hypothetical protein [Eubacterium sp.]